MAEKTYHGSCSCGKVRFEVMLDLAKGTFKCNCTTCTKARFWGAAVEPDAFKLLSGEGDLTIYTRSVQHYFCKHCGVKLFGRSKPEGDRKFVAISLGALDDLKPAEWAQAPVQYIDGRNDNWAQEPEITAHL